jgi:Tol biopolymer transport system component
LYDLSDRSITQLNDHPGAGYEPVFTKDGRRIIFRVDEYIKMRKYSALAIQTIGDKKIEYLSEKMRFLSPALSLYGNRVAAVADKEVRTFTIDKKESAQSVGLQEPATYIEDQKIALVKDGEKAILAPFGDGNYIWSSLSPDKTRLLFTFAGSGTFIADLSGSIISELGIARAPKWSPDGKWVVYMVDEDDGHVITASDIWVASSDGQKKFQLTKTTDIKEMYPAWSPSMDKIAFDTVDGRIGYLTIEISE